MSVFKQTYQQWSLITAPKIHTDLLWDLSTLFVVLAAAYFIFIFFYRNRIGAQRDSEKHRKKEISPMISEFLFYEEDASKDEKSNYINLKILIRQLIKDNFNRKVLSEVLLDLQKDVSGNTQERLFNLYQDLGFHNDDFKRLKSWRWEIVSTAIINLTRMQVSEAYTLITRFINDKRHTIRKQAEIAVVALKPEGINYFLDTTKHRISEWQQLKIIEVLRTRESYEPPKFKGWLTSANHYVVLFALRLIKYYNQNDSDAALIELLKHKNVRIREEAIACIKEFNVVQAVPVLKLVFWKSSTDVKIAILNAIAVLGTASDIEFLKLIENKESSFLVRSKAHSAINTISPDSIMPTKGLMDTANLKIPSDIEINKHEEEIQIGHNNSQEVSNKNDIKTAIEEGSIAHEQPNSNSNDNSILSSENQQGKNIKEQETKVEESETLNFDFIPHVIQTELKTANELKSSNMLNQMHVNFEEVTFNKEFHSTKKKNSSVEITDEEIAFLPIVTKVDEELIINEIVVNQASIITSINEMQVKYEEVENVTNHYNKTKQASEYSEYSSLEILETIVSFEEISEDFTEHQPEFKFESLQPGSSEEKINTEESHSQSHNPLKNTNDQKLEKIYKDLIGFGNQVTSEDDNKEFINFPLLAFDDDFFVPKKTEGNPLEVQDQNDNEFQEKSENPITISDIVLDDDFFDEITHSSDENEESLMQLLDDIREMGDEREIPLLNEFLLNEKYTAVKDRIKRLIEEFSETDKVPEVNISIKPYNIFEDLFRNCDTEKKLILMNEIVAVGDEAEIIFLESLLNDPEIKIQNKSAIVLEELKEKLSTSNSIESTSKKTVSQTNPNKQFLEEDAALLQYESLMKKLQIEPSYEKEIFEIDFELENLESEINIDLREKNTVSKKRSLKKIVLNKMYVISNIIIDKLSG